jgi:hypothetical protein
LQLAGAIEFPHRFQYRKSFASASASLMVEEHV